VARVAKWSIIVVFNTFNTSRRPGGPLQTVLKHGEREPRSDDFPDILNIPSVLHILDGNVTFMPDYGGIGVEHSVTFRHFLLFSVTFLPTLGQCRLPGRGVSDNPQHS